MELKAKTQLYDDLRVVGIFAAEVAAYIGIYLILKALGSPSWVALIAILIHAKLDGIKRAIRRDAKGFIG